MKVFERIPHLDDNRLFQLFQNALNLINTDKDQQAKSVLNLIESEWKKRKEAYIQGSYRPALPKKGMLASFHYHVGETQGVKKEHRHKILDQIITRELPIIQSPAYTLEWGEKNSCERLKKLSNSLSAFIYDAQTGFKKNLNFDMAIMDWSDDLDFLKENYYYSLNCSYKWPDVNTKN